MPTGLQVFSEHYETLIDITDRITKVLFIGTVPITGVSNVFTLTDPAFLQGIPFVHCHMSNSISSSKSVQEVYSCMTVSSSLNGSTFTVNYGYTTSQAYEGSFKEPLFLVIGVY